MHTKKVKDCKIHVPKAKAFAYDTSPNMIKLHTNTVCVGVRGIGKSVAVTSMINMLPFDRIFVISPSMKSNKELMDRLNINEEDIYDDPDDVTCLDKIKKILTSFKRGI